MYVCIEYLEGAGEEGDRLVSGEEVGDLTQHV